MQKALLQVEAITSDALVMELEKRFSKIIDAKLSKLQPQANEDPFITRQDVANMFHITLPTVHSWVHAGILKHYKIGNKTRFLLSEVKAAAINPGRKMEDSRTTRKVDVYKELRTEQAKANTAIDIIQRMVAEFTGAAEMSDKDYDKELIKEAKLHLQQWKGKEGGYDKD